MARNSGMEKATGDYILFLDSDDFFGHDLVKNLCEAAQRTGADIVIGNHRKVFADGSIETAVFPPERRFTTPEDMRYLLLNTVGALPNAQNDSEYGVSACSRLYRRTVIDANKIRFIPEKALASEDLLFNLDFISNAKSAVVTQDASYFYCTNAGSLSKCHRENRFAKDIELYLMVRDHLMASFSEDEYLLYLQRLLISRARFDMIQEVLYHDRVDRSYPLRERMTKIIQSPELQCALEHYPWRELPKMQGIFTYFMKKNRLGILTALIRVKNRFLQSNQNI